MPPSCQIWPRRANTANASVILPGLATAGTSISIATVGIEQWVPLDRVAHHVRGQNADSVGIELVNLGRWPNWYASDNQDWSEPYSQTQIQALIELLNKLQGELPCLAEIAGHDQLDHPWSEPATRPGFACGASLTQDRFSRGPGCSKPPGCAACRQRSYRREAHRTE